MDFAYRIPGTTGPDITIRRSRLGGVSVHVNGQKLKPGRGNRFDIQLPGGATAQLQISGLWTGLRVTADGVPTELGGGLTATADGVETELEPRVPAIYLALTIVPVGLALLGGALGGLIGVGAAVVNLAIARTPRPGPVKLAAMVGVIAVAVGVWGVVVVALTPLPTFATGDCLNVGLRDIADGTNLDPVKLRPVNCAIPHRSEVVGVLTYPGEGGYPDSETMEAFATTGCRQAFAEYVGASLDGSSLIVSILTPTSLSWLKGDRDVDCVAIPILGNQLTGSIRGTRQ